MQFVALSVAVVTALASLGVALWTWHSMSSIGDDFRDFAGFESSPFEARDDRT